MLERKLVEANNRIGDYVKLLKDAQARVAELEDEIEQLTRELASAYEEGTPDVTYDMYEAYNDMHEAYKTLERDDGS